jgi:pSer/pThr/pTyr-binding forkhead associated (FHA) protein
MSEETRVFAKDLVFEVVNSGRAVRLFDQFTIGREDCHWTVLNDPSISRRHLKVHVNAGKVLIEDLGTKNRTRLNGKPMVSGMKYLLNSGDEVEIGNQKLIFRSEATSPLGSGPKTLNQPALDGEETPENKVEITPPRLPLIERPAIEDNPPAQFESASNVPEIEYSTPPEPPKEDSNTNPGIGTSLGIGTGLIPELAFDEIPSDPVHAPVASELKLPPMAAKSVDLDLPPPLLLSSQPTPPSIERLKAYTEAHPKPKTDGITDFFRMKRYPKHQWTILAVALIYPIWSYVEDALLTYNYNGLPHSIVELSIKFLIALVIAFPVAFFPNWWLNQKKVRPSVLKVATPASGLAFLVLFLWICTHNGYLGMSLRNQVMAYCSIQFDLDRCRALVYSPDRALAGIPPATQNEIHQRISTELRNRAPASGQPENQALANPSENQVPQQSSEQNPQ